jgi:hypothetical protein
MKASESLVISIVVMPFPSVVNEQPEGPSDGKQSDWLKKPELPVGPSPIFGSTTSAFTTLAADRRKTATVRKARK